MMEKNDIIEIENDEYFVVDVFELENNKYALLNLMGKEIKPEDSIVLKVENDKVYSIEDKNEAKLVLEYLNQQMKEEE